VTRYQLLCRLNGNGGWQIWRVEEAHSAEAAISKAYLRESKQAIVAAVAVPAKSWKPQAIRTETVTKVHLGEPVVEKQEQGE
jgi:hypothetical protein